jgi:hypothetical protein
VPAGRLNPRSVAYRLTGHAGAAELAYLDHGKLRLPMTGGIHRRKSP